MAVDAVHNKVSFLLSVFYASEPCRGWRHIHLVGDRLHNESKLSGTTISIDKPVNLPITQSAGNNIGIAVYALGKDFRKTVATISSTEYGNDACAFCARLAGVNDLYARQGITIRIQHLASDGASIGNLAEGNSCQQGKTGESRANTRS